MLLVACDKRRAVVFEMTTKSLVVRTAEDHLLACTNHFRTEELGLAKGCERYRRLATYRTAGNLLDWTDVVRAMKEVGHGDTLQTMVFEPDPLRLRVALGDPPASENPLVTLDLTGLFGHEVVDRRQQ